jgi:hypothetical protein
VVNLVPCLLLDLVEVTVVRNQRIASIFV